MRKYPIITTLALGIYLFAFAGVAHPIDSCQKFNTRTACQKLSGGKCVWDEENLACQGAVKLQYHHHCYHHCHYMCEQDYHCFWSHYEGACYPR
jgi:hypothetical protein